MEGLRRFLGQGERPTKVEICLKQLADAQSRTRQEDEGFWYDMLVLGINESPIAAAAVKFIGPREQHQDMSKVWVSQRQAQV
jgi:hypothetical protein